jgi:hypothetical protein
LRLCGIDEELCEGLYRGAESKGSQVIYQAEEASSRDLEFYSGRENYRMSETYEEEVPGSDRREWNVYKILGRISKQYCQASQLLYIPIRIYLG